MENSVEECELPTEECQWRQELEHHQSQLDALHDKFMEVKGNIKCSEEEAEKELEHLCNRVKTIATLLTYLKSKAKIMAVPHLAHTSCGIKHQQGIGFVDKNGIPLSDWSKDVDLSQFESSDDSLDGILKSVHLVTDVMESLVKRVILAETEAASEKEKVKEGVEEIRRKSLQIDTMSARVEEMENFAQGTNTILNEMKHKVEDMVQETSRQRQRAAENEQELRRVKQDFESLRSYVSGLISVRETLLSSEKQIQTIEKLFDSLLEILITKLESTITLDEVKILLQIINLKMRADCLPVLIAKTTHLENEKEQKEAEVQKLMEENVRLRAQLDKKEAQLLAMSEQCKFMALNNSNR